MTSIETSLKFLLNQENKYLAYAINTLTNRKTFILEKCGIDYDIIVSSIRSELNMINELYKKLLTH